MEMFPILDALHGDSNHVCMVMNSAAIPRLYPILQAGFFMPCLIGTAMSAFLKDRMGVSAQYIEERISTVFLNGKPVDNLETAIIEEGSTLALSSAMPGLVGASLRRKGFYASLRSAITYDRKVEGPSVKQGVIRVKLFNLVMADLGPSLLKLGIYVRANDFGHLLADQPSHFYEAVKTATVDGRPTEPVSLGKAYLPAAVEWTEVKVCESP
jgi:hypothetical protein